MDDFKCKYSFNVKMQSHHPNDLNHVFFTIYINSTVGIKSFKIFFNDLEESIENLELKNIIKSKLDENFDMQELSDMVSCNLINKISNRIEEFATNEGLI